MSFVYLICFGVGLLFTIITAFASHLFSTHEAHISLDHHVDGGSHGHAEAGNVGDMPGFSAFSPTVVTAFVTAFGGCGMIFEHIPATQSPLVSAPLAVLSGLLIAAVVLWLFRAIFNATQASSESRISTLPGVTATVITPIPANGVGEIAYVQGGSRYTAPAREESGAAVSSGTAVKIKRVLGTQYYVTLE